MVRTLCFHQGPGSIPGLEDAASCATRPKTNKRTNKQIDKKLITSSKTSLIHRSHAPRWDPNLHIQFSVKRMWSLWAFLTRLVMKKFCQNLCLNWVYLPGKMKGVSLSHMDVCVCVCVCVCVYIYICMSTCACNYMCILYIYLCIYIIYYSPI